MHHRVEACPSCRQERVCAIVAAVRVEGEPLLLLACPEPSCALLWAVPADVDGMLLLVA